MERCGAPSLSSGPVRTAHPDISLRVMPLARLAGRREPHALAFRRGGWQKDTELAVPDLRSLISDL